MKNRMRITPHHVGLMVLVPVAVWLVVRFAAPLPEGEALEKMKWSMEYRQDERAALRGLAEAPGARAGEAAGTPVGGFKLINHRGAAVSERDFAADYLLLVFGHSGCPSECLERIDAAGRAVAALAGDARRVRPLFVTVDPDRDTVGRLEAFVAAAGVPGLVALTGNPAEIIHLARSLEVPGAQEGTAGMVRALEGAPPALYLLAPGVRTLARFEPGQSADAVAARIRDWF